MDGRLRAALLAALLLTGCGEETPRTIEKEVYFIVSDYCLSWGTYQLDHADPDEPLLSELSGNLAAVDVALVDDGLFTPVSPPGCRPIPVGNGLLDPATVLGAAGLVAEVPALDEGNRYRLVGGFFGNDAECAEDAFLVCAISREFGADADPLSLYLLCPPIPGEDGACGFGQPCPDGALCWNHQCQDTFDEHFPGNFPIIYDTCKALHGEVLRAAQ